MPGSKPPPIPPRRDVRFDRLARLVVHGLPMVVAMQASEALPMSSAPVDSHAASLMRKTALQQKSAPRSL